jgi:hypothetical protein
MVPDTPMEDPPDVPVRLPTPLTEAGRFACVAGCGYKERLSNLYRHYDKYLEGKNADVIHARVMDQIRNACPVK